MLVLESKNIERADERREIPHGHVDVVELPGLTLGRVVLEPGWRWSESVKPIEGTDSCQHRHAGYVASGRLHIRMNDGTEKDIAQGDVMVCDPGHDAWTVGDQPCVLFDVASSVADYAAPSKS
jgi:quercetin dioxygenase-like cupin family protein